jgi:hypothetical protein
MMWLALLSNQMSPPGLPFEPPSTGELPQASHREELWTPTWIRSLQCCLILARVKLSPFLSVINILFPPYIVSACKTFILVIGRLRNESNSQPI